MLTSHQYTVSNNGKIYTMTRNYIISGKQKKNNDKPKKKMGRKVLSKTKIIREFVNMTEKDIDELYNIIAKFKRDNNIPLFDEIDINQYVTKKAK